MYYIVVLCIRMLLQYRIMSKSIFDIDYLLASNSCVGMFIQSFRQFALNPILYDILIR